MRGRRTRSSPALSVASALARVEGPREPHASREPAERALGQMEGGVTVLAGGGSLVADDEERVPHEYDFHGIRSDPRELHGHQNPVGRFDHVDGRRALRPSGPLSVIQAIEQTADVIVHVAAFEKYASHVDLYSNKLARLRLRPSRLRLARFNL